MVKNSGRKWYQLRDVLILQNAEYTARLQPLFNMQLYRALEYLSVGRYLRNVKILRIFSNVSIGQ